MFFNKIFYFLKGYVIIDIRGKGFARFLSMCTARGVRLWNITPGRAYVWASDFAALRQAAKKAGVSVRIVKKCGLRYDFIRSGRWFAAVAAAVFVLLMFIGTQYVWQVDIEGCDEQTAERVKERAEEFGLRAGVRKSSLPDGNTMRDELIYNIDEINWAWVYLEGMRARIAVSENIPAPNIEFDNTPCNISAAREGILKRVSVTGGRAVLSAGVKVEPGDIIISGAMPGGQMVPPYEVAAEGEVFAETLHTKSCDYPLYRTHLVDTGAQKVYYSLRLFELELPLFHGKIDFDEYRTELKTPPVGICSYRYIETETITEPISLQTAEYEAREILYEQIAAELAPGSSRTDEQLISKKISEDTLRVTLTMSFIENIGVKTPIKQWQTEELNK